MENKEFAGTDLQIKESVAKYSHLLFMNISYENQFSGN